MGVVDGPDGLSSHGRRAEAGAALPNVWCRPQSAGVHVEAVRTSRRPAVACRCRRWRPAIWPPEDAPCAKPNIFVWGVDGLAEDTFRARHDGMTRSAPQF